MYAMRVWYKDGRVELYQFESEQKRATKANWYRTLSTVEKVTFFEFKD